VDVNGVLSWWESGDVHANHDGGIDTPLFEDHFTTQSSHVGIV
jgi:hypothetical protein